MTGRWEDSAACAFVDPDLWFPALGQPGTAARRICAGCPVREQCLDDATAMVYLPTHGIWGGLGVHELRAEAARRGRQVPCVHCSQLFTWTPASPWYCSDGCRRAQRREQAAASRRRAGTRVRRQAA